LLFKRGYLFLKEKNYGAAIIEWMGSHFRF